MPKGLGWGWGGEKPITCQNSQGKDQAQVKCFHVTEDKFFHV